MDESIYFIIGGANHFIWYETAVSCTTTYRRVFKLLTTFFLFLILTSKSCVALSYHVSLSYSFKFIFELLRYIRKLRCTGTPTSKIFKLTIIFME